MQTGNGKIIAGLIFLFIAVYGIITGGVNDLIPGLIFAGVGVLLIYLKVTERKRFTHREQRRIEEKKNNTIQSAKLRFNNSTFVTHLIRDCRARNWSDLNYVNGGCQVLTDKIVTPYKTYLYDDFGLNRLDIKGCEQLAVYIGELFGRKYEVEEISQFFGGYTGGYSGYVGSDGSISVSRNYSGGERTLGYKVYSTSSKPNPKPQGKAW